LQGIPLVNCGDNRQCP